MARKVNFGLDVYFAEGWSGSGKIDRWSIGNKSIITFPIINNGKDIILNLNLMPYLNKKLKEQTIRFIMAGQILKEEKMDKKRKLYRVNIPNKYIKDGILELTIELQNPVSSPAEVGSKDSRKLGISLSEMYFE